MQLHVDRAQRVVIETQRAPWVSSPMPGVQRLYLERDGGEVARATSLVRFAPGAHFSHHTHELGEEFFVLEGTFVDEDAIYPAGTYVRHPPGSSHQPHSPDGCLLFVKLRQFEPDDLALVVIQTQHLRGASEAGLDVLPLHEFRGVQTTLRRFAPGAIAPAHAHPGGEEIFVISGSLEDEHGHYPARTWIRSPRGSSHQPRSAEGCVLLVKHGHL